MIDMLVLRCSFSKEFNLVRRCMDFPFFKLEDLGIPLVQFRDSDGSISSVRHSWEKIPSSFEGIAFKVFDHRFDALECFYIEVKASPAKIMQGHNVFGSSDFCDCALSLITTLCISYPVLVDKLDFMTWSLAQIDITYSSRAKTEKEAVAFINALQNVSYGQTRSRDGCNGTAYFGKKNSRLKKIKVYAKYSEVLKTINDKKKQKQKENDFVIDDDLLKFSEGLIRWEVSLFHRHFERMGISCDLTDIIQSDSFSPAFLRVYWQTGMQDLFTATKGQQMKVIDDDEVLEALRAKFSKTSSKTGLVSTTAADSAFRTYRNIRRDGWLNVKNLMAKNTFNDHVRMICQCSVSRAALQNMNGLDDGSKFLNFSEFTQVDFDAQFPDWYEPKPPTFSRDIFFKTGVFDFLTPFKKMISKILSS